MTPRGHFGIVASLALIVLGMAVPAAAAVPDAVAVGPLQHVNAELENVERAEFARYLTGLSTVEQVALIDLAYRLPLGARGLFVARLLEGSSAQRTSMTRLLALLTAVQRSELAEQLAWRAPALWEALFRYVEIVPAAEAAGMLFDPAFTQSAMIYRYIEESGDQAMADRPDLVESAKGANVEAGDDFQQAWNPPPGISGGSPAAPHSAPWQVQIYKSGASASPLTPIELRRELKNFGTRLENFERWHDCGGVLIAPGWVLTAAHCIKNPALGPFLETRRVRTGTDFITAGGTTWRIAGVVRHGGYSARSKKHDIALLRIVPDGQTKVSLNRAAKPIRLATVADGRLTSRETLIVTGWGVTAPTDIGSRYRDHFGLAKRPSARLLEAQVRPLPLDDCNRHPNFRKVQATVAMGQLCAGGDHHSDACQGDSGGPLVRRPARRNATLIGLVSFGPGCGLADTPGVYVDVRYYRQWIRSAMKQVKANRIVDWPR